MAPIFHYGYPQAAGPGPDGPGPRACELSQLRLVRISGPDSLQFLQGQVTQDVRAAGAERSVPFGLTTRQGRLLATGELFTWADALCLTVPEATATSLVQRLRTYVLRARVSIEIAPVRLLGLWNRAAPVGEQPAGGTPVTVAPVTGSSGCAVRLAADPARILVAVPGDADATAIAPDAPEADWWLAELRAGVPLILPATSDRWTPQMVNLDLLAGISLTKGCYVGQEIVARTHHLGRVKRRMLRLRAPAGASLLPGTPIHAVGHEAGEVVTALEVEGALELLAVIRLDVLPARLFADAQESLPLERLPLPYAIPEEAGTAGE